MSKKALWLDVIQYKVHENRVEFDERLFMRVQVCSWAHIEGGSQ